MNRRTLLTYLIAFFLGVNVCAQEIEIDVNDQALNTVLIDLRIRYGTDLSFDDAALAKYRINMSATFKDMESTIEALLKDLPLTYMQSGGVFIIYPDTKKQEPARTSKTYLLNGKIIEQNSLEGLPYSNVLINGKGMCTDEYGRFSFKSEKDSVFHVQASYLGYYHKDTLLYAGEIHAIRLSPSNTEIKAVVINERILENFVCNNYEPGILNLNHKVSSFLPGSSDNSVFNLLRLQSGILASAEQSTELIVWGSYEGQSRIIFDDFVLFGLRNFNDNISSVNPFAVKNIRLMKAGFDAEWGSCVGGIASITGKDSYSGKTSVNASVNNYTVNTFIEQPITKYSSLSLGFRYTYRNLYDQKDIQLFKNSQSGVQDATIEPDYNFADLNLKYNYLNKNDFHIRFSLLTGKDDFSYTIDEEILNRTFQRSSSENNFQYGSSLVLGKKFSQGLSSDIKVSWSGLYSYFYTDNKISFIGSGNEISNRNLEVQNNTSELKVAWQNKYPLTANHQLEAHLEYTRNISTWLEDSLQYNLFNQEITGDYYTMILQDKMVFGSTNIKPGLRINYVPRLQKSYFEPRITVSQQASKNVSFKIAIGVYNQFVSKSSVVDEYNNYRYMWVVADNDSYPVLTAYHWVGGISYSLNKTKISLEPYYKTTKGLSRYAYRQQRGFEDVFEGESKSYGLDFYLKQDFWKHTAWVSYTYNKTLEHFDYQIKDEFNYAPQDQRHEVKLASILNFDPFYFSANYVYGSGFPIPDISRQGFTYSRTPYHRVDMALVARFAIKQKFFCETGVSILNVFNTQNVLYSNLERVPIDQTSSIDIYSESVPFTPTVYLKIHF